MLLGSAPLCHHRGGDRASPVGTIVPTSPGTTLWWVGKAPAGVGVGVLTFEDPPPKCSGIPEVGIWPHAGPTPGGAVGVPML